ncbi:MAG TPA: hypothetical protein VMU89_14865 [Thermomicrobiaceae bacterium]|nr:hypothetical protein [Thermomicrobiaceae bacterium]
MTLYAVADSFTAPSDAQLERARYAGVAAWNGYLPGLGIDSTWIAADFARIRAAGLGSIAFASGNEDPDKMAALAAAWKVRGCLDDEPGIRAFGTWEQSWLDASGFGHYHEAWDFPELRAAFHVIALYQQQNPSASWPTPADFAAQHITAVARPPGACGWQWRPNVIAYAAHVDLSWFDSAIYTTTPTPTEENEMQTVIVDVAPPGEVAAPTLIPGVTGSTSIVLAAFKPCTLTMFLWDEHGNTVAARQLALSGNQPAVHGPVEVAGFLYQIFATPPAIPGPAAPAKSGVPYLLALYPGSSTYSASLF